MKKGIMVLLIMIILFSFGMSAPPEMECSDIWEENGRCYQMCDIVTQDEDVYCMEISWEC